MDADVCFTQDMQNLIISLRRAQTRFQRASHDASRQTHEIWPVFACQ